MRFLFSILATISTTLIPSGPVFQNAQEMEHVTVIAAEGGIPFRITGNISGFEANQYPLPSQLIFRDETGSTVLSNNLRLDSPAFHPNDLVEACGTISTQGRGIYAKLDSLRLIAHQPSECKHLASIRDLIQGEFDCKKVVTQGTVANAFHDEIEPSWAYMILTDGTNSLYAPIIPHNFGISNIDDLQGATVELTGWCCASALTGARKHLGRFFTTARHGFRIVRKSPHDPFSVPFLDDCRQRSPMEISRLGPHRVIGTVLASWHHNQFLVKDANGQLSCVKLTQSDLPAFGDQVEVIGMPETDLYHVNLSAARWRMVRKAQPQPQPVAKEIDVQDMFHTYDGHPCYDTRLHGRPIRVKGTVRIIPQPEDPDGLLYIESKGLLVAADFGVAPASLAMLKPGSLVSLAGTCVLESENWRPTAIFPSIRRAILVGRTADDLEIISDPPWWTPLKLFLLCATLLTGLIAITVWNRFLTQRVRQQNLRLFSARLEQISADLKTMERTRLAIELHDSLAQNLTGVALQLQTAQETIHDDAAIAAKHLETANRSLLSCRAELRNCLRDLRSEALETDNVDDAIRMTLAPHVGNTAVTVRFQVPRERISDNTLHAVLRIIRELVLNAIRHGQATSVKVAGAIEDDRLLFSVSDNGRGFNAEKPYGPQEGHFGLQGIRERINDFNGTFEIDSKPGRGTKATLSLLLPQEDKS